MMFITLVVISIVVLTLAIGAISYAHHAGSSNVISL